MVRIFQPISEIYVLGTHGRQTISEGVHIFQLTCEIYVPGGPNISEYKDRGEPFWGGPNFL